MARGGVVAGLFVSLVAVGAGAAPKPGIASIRSLEGEQVAVQFNPKEIGVDKSVPWQKAKNSHANTPDLEFTSADGRSLSFELFFDTYEQGCDFAPRLESLLDIDPKLGRPLRYAFGFGPREFEGVLESVSTKYTMFRANGDPVRCTITVKLREAGALSVASDSTAGTSAD